jgi:hypothetical protein
MEMKVVDADGHVVERDRDIRAYLPEPYCNRRGSLVPSDGLDTSMGGRLGGLEDNDLETRLKDMDREGIDVSVLFPTSSFAVSSFISAFTTAARGRWRTRASRASSIIYMHTIGRPVETFIQFAGLIYGGVPERFPRLRIAFLECGAGWVPYWMERMDEEWEKRGKVEAPRCRRKPSEYVLHGNLFFAAEPEEGMLPYVIERIGEDRILFASDYPHWDGMFPRVVSTIRGRQDLSDSAKRKILGENAKRFYGWA